MPQAFKALSEELSEETIKLMKSVLPHGLDISSEEILKFLKECRWEGIHIRQSSFSEKRRAFKPCQTEWEKLVTSPEPKYIKARETLLKDEPRTLGEYLIGDKYEPWPQTITYSLLGQPKRGKDTRGPTGHVVGLYKKYGFIEAEDPQARRDEITYRRVDEAMPYLRRILQSR